MPTVELIMWPTDDSSEDRDSFVVKGYRVNLQGASIRVELIPENGDAHAVAEEYVAAIRDNIGGIARPLLIEEFNRLPPRSITIFRQDQRARAIRRRHMLAHGGKSSPRITLG